LLCQINDSLVNKFRPEGGLFSEYDDLARRGLLYQSRTSGHLFVLDDPLLPQYILNRLEAPMPFGLGAVTPVAPS
jgi:hypothetical protein